MTADIERQEESHNCVFTCHSGTSYEIQTVPQDPHTFLSCGEDGTVRWFDLRTKESCERGNCREDILISVSSPVTTISLNPLLPYHLAVGASDSTVRIFDRRMLSPSSSHDGESSRAGKTVKERSLEALLARFSVPEFGGKNKRITSVQYRPDGQEVLASYSSDYIYIFNPLVQPGNNLLRAVLQL